MQSVPSSKYMSEENCHWHINSFYHEDLQDAYDTYQGATIRLPDCPGQSVFGLENHDLQKSCPTEQVKVQIISFR